LITGKFRNGIGQTRVVGSDSVQNAPCYVVPAQLRDAPTLLCSSPFPGPERAGPGRTRAAPAADHLHPERTQAPNHTSRPHLLDPPVAALVGKIQAELGKLGITVSLATVSRYLPKRNPDHDQRQRWKTFLRNHKDGIAAMDFIVVPTVRFRLLHVWFVIGHGRRKIIHFGVTAHPTSSWVMQQLREAFPNDAAPRFLIYDNDSIFSERITEMIDHLAIEPRRTAFRSSWQNGIAERWVGSARRELLDHVVVLNEKHLRCLLREYVDYYNADRVHTRLRDSSMGRPTKKRPARDTQVIGLPRVGGLHHRYEWQEAA
jgi:putative transposase